MDAWKALLRRPQAIFLLVFFLGSALPGGAEPAVEPSPERRSREIVLDLEAGRTQEALQKARAAAKLFPTSALLQRRLGQSHLARAMVLGLEVAHATETVGLARALERGTALLRDPATAQRQEARGRTEEFATFLKALEAEDVTRFSEDARRQLALQTPLLEQRTHSLLDGQAALEEARRLGDETTEQALTALWSMTIPLIWQRDAILTRPTPAGIKPSLDPAGKPVESPEEALTRVLAPFAEITREKVLRSAAELARQRPDDPAALAGAADVISVAQQLGGRPDPLLEYVRHTLDTPVLDGTPRPGAPVSGIPRAARDLYDRARDGKAPDVVDAPTAAAIQLYDRALQQDAKGTLPNLRLRVYLLRLAFDPNEARQLLDELARLQPRNAVVRLERARAAFLLNSHPADGLALCREGTRLPEFSRSFLVAAPAPLRRTLNLAVGRSFLTKSAWPGYEWLFSTLTHAQLSRNDPAWKREFRLLRLALAERLERAPDYYDQAVGIDQKTRALTELAAESAQLPPEQQAFFQARLEDHQRRSAAFPASVNVLTFTSDGFKPNRFPRLRTGRMGGYMLEMMPSGFAGFGYGSGLY